MSENENNLLVGNSFKDRIGEASEFDAALGQVLIAFSVLERNLSEVITILLDLSPDMGQIVTAEQSFRGLVNLVSSIAKYKSARGDFNIDSNKPYEEIQETLKTCFKAEELRNQVIHSRYILDQFRIKTTAKAKHGLRTTSESVSPESILDISDFISNVAIEVEEIPIILNLADSINYVGLSKQYIFKDQLVVVFADDLQENF